MIRTIVDFTEEWAYERETTRKVLDRLTDASLGQEVTPGGRTLGRLAWHLVQTLVEMPGHAGIPVAGPGMEEPAPLAAREIGERYTAAAESLGKAVEATWTDAALGEDVAMYGDVWKKGQVLSALIKHEAHHRGQMTVLMRQAGLTVPGVYGPAREEWAAFGMAALD